MQIIDGDISYEGNNADFVAFKYEWFFLKKEEMSERMKPKLARRIKVFRDGPGAHELDRLYEKDDAALRRGSAFRY